MVKPRGLKRWNKLALGAGSTWEFGLVNIYNFIKRWYGTRRD